MTEIVLKCGHKIKTNDFDSLECEICTKKKIIDEDKEKEKENNPEYINVMSDIVNEFKKVNPSIHVVVTQDKSGSINYKFIEKAQLFMKIFHSEKAFEYEIRNVKNQPVQELKNILIGIKEKGELAKEFRSMFGKSSLRFITDQIYYELNYDGKTFTFENCTKRKQQTYLTIALTIIGAVFGIMFGV